MRDLKTLTYHPIAEKIVDILCKKTQNANPMFFRILVSYYLAKMASTMRVTVLTKDRGEIPVNMYAINLAPSGQGKGHSTNIIEDQLISKFRTAFFEETFPLASEESLTKLATRRAHIRGEDPDQMLALVKKEFVELGQMAFSFDSGTTAAVKQMRHKLLMASIGSMNLEIDEIGSNLLGNADVLTTFLELFDVGKVKNKLTKNTKENVRNEEIEGKTPTNMLLFGTPAKLLNGGKVEEEFYSFLETGYARRCLFGYTRFAVKDRNMTPKEIYDALTDQTTNAYIQQLSDDFGRLAHYNNWNKIITVSEPVSLDIISYRMHCEELAEKMGEHEEIRRAEMSHRYFKALKLAGVYAFIDNSPMLTDDHFWHAVHLVEESGRAFDGILRRDRHYVKLAKYIAGMGMELTHVDLTEDLQFYRGSNAQKADLMSLAIAWGYRNQVIIKKNVIGNIEFFKGETLAPTNLDELTLAHSPDIADGYKNVLAPWDRLWELSQMPGHNWISHHVDNGHRSDAHIVKGFDMVVVDVDSGNTTIDAVRMLLKDHKYLLYTTKRHDPQKHRFRLILPMNFRLELDETEFREFMSNVHEWLPFQVDTSAAQRSRKWLTNPGYYEYGPGDQLLDAMLFIPRTTKNEERKKLVQTYSSLSNLERWFVQNITTGNRNNQLLRYALMLVDLGHPLDQVRTNVLAMNDKLVDKLDIPEIDSTIMVTAARALAKLP